MVKIINRDRLLDNPQRNTCDKLDRDVAAGTLTKAEYERRAAIILARPCAVPKSLRAAGELFGEYARAA